MFTEPRTKRKGLVDEAYTSWRRQRTMHTGRMLSAATFQQLARKLKCACHSQTDENVMFLVAEKPANEIGKNAE